MNRLLSILVSLVILFFLYLWISHISSNPKYTGQPVNTPEKNVQTPVTAAPNRSDEVVQPAPEIPGKDDEPTIDGTTTDTPPPSESTTEQEPEDKKSEATSEATRFLIDGGHLVIAGNFLELANAQKHLDRLKELGYADSEIVHFELSEYHTVCAGRFQDPLEARRFAKKIEDTHGIDTYVRSANQ